MTPYDDDISLDDWLARPGPEPEKVAEPVQVPFDIPATRDFEKMRVWRKLVVVEIKDEPLPERKKYTGGKKHKSKRRFLYELQEGRCAYCELPFSIDDMTLDHVIPKSKGGSDDIENIVVACRSCNWLKGPHETFEEVAVLVASRFLRTRAEMERYAHLLAFFKKLKDKGFIPR